jgi:hypothetical protein
VIVRERDIVNKLNALDAMQREQKSYIQQQQQQLTNGFHFLVPLQVDAFLWFLKNFSEFYAFFFKTQGLRNKTGVVVFKTGLSPMVWKKRNARTTAAVL